MRKIYKDDYVEKFIGAKNSVVKVKNEFGKKVQLNIILKDYKDSKYNKRIEEVFVNVNSVKKYTKFKYTKDEIKKLIS